MKSPSELFYKSSAKLFDQSHSKYSPRLSPLLLLDDQPPDLPIASYHLDIDVLQGTASSLYEDYPDLLVNALNDIVILHLHQWILLYRSAYFFKFLPVTIVHNQRL